MESLVGIQMPSNWIGMKCNEDNIMKAGWNDLKSSVRSTSPNRFAEDQHVLFDHDE